MKFLAATLIAACGFALVMPQAASAVYRPCESCHSQCPCASGCTYYLDGPLPIFESTGLTALTDPPKEFLGGFPVHTTCGAYTAQNGGSCLQTGSVSEDQTLGGDLLLEGQSEQAAGEETETALATPTAEAALQP